jgi:Cytochrome P460
VSGLAWRAARTDTDGMKTTTLALAAGLIFCYSLSQGDSPGGQGHKPAYTAEGRLIFPTDYRDWVFLTAGLDMSYTEGMQMGSHHMLDNVFVNPAAYKSFLATGTWPDGTMLVKENRRADTEGSINKSGQFQSTEIMGIEIHVKDAGHFPDQWAFFAFGDALKPAAMIPQAASCYSCHAAHGAVDRTFVQFYPTLLPVATAKGTLSEGYRHDESSRSTKAVPPSHGGG